MFIVFEGVDGLGKTTVMTMIRDWLESEMGIPTVTTREPGSTEVGMEIRSLILKRGIGDLMAESLLFAADRVLNLKLNIIPALSLGKWVLSDRFVYSTLAYQAVTEKDFLNMLTIHNTIVKGVTPDLVFLFDGPPGLFKNLDRQDSVEGRGLEYMNEVRERYLKLANWFNAKRRALEGRDLFMTIRILSESGVPKPVEKVFEEVKSKVTEYMHT